MSKKRTADYEKNAIEAMADPAEAAAFLAMLATETADPVFNAAISSIVALMNAVADENARLRAALSAQDSVSDMFAVRMIVVRDDDGGDKC